jgi:cytolysin (calcineurin-like family phosphatase)
VVVVDVNSDSKPDIIVANYGSNNVGVLLNTGNGTFIAQTTYSTGSSPTPRSVAVVDVNSDSKPDIIVTNYGSNTVGVLLNTGSGTFTAQTTYSTSSGPNSVAVVDVNSDSKPDIIVTNYGSNNVGVLLAYCN